jgi:uncharacterized membrane protein (DUF106 family)
LSEKKGIAGVIMTFLISVVGLVLTPTVQDLVDDAVGNLTGPAQDILDLFPLFWVIMLIGIPIGAIYLYFKD